MSVLSANADTAHFANVTPEVDRKFPSGGQTTLGPAASPQYVSPLGTIGLPATNSSYGGQEQTPFPYFDAVSAFYNPYALSEDAERPQLHSPFGMFGHMSTAVDTTSDRMSTDLMHLQGLVSQGTATLPFSSYDQRDASALTDQDLSMAYYGDFKTNSANGGRRSAISGPQHAMAPSVPPNNPDFVPPRPQQKQGNSRDRQANGLYFNNLDEAIFTIPPPDWHCPPNDTSIPSTDGERQHWVLKLLTALSNTEDVWDKPTAAFKKHWLDPSYYAAADKEILCWDILALTENLHRSGPGSLLSFDLRFWDQARKSWAWTFRERMEKIIELLTKSKARCEKLLGGSGMHIIVANPGVLIASSKGNIKQNRKRQGFLEAGRATKKQKTQKDA